ncbi:hypothetical protein [Hydrogenophaga sp.]|jgi:hypothetical protein|uniref:hypothetical protein n=1 Tax=Hydrogenophaga sp. TaxID=1904254 RepID=UPI00271E05BA|nr:hypothetical protein [Hydrogenophaga sp.]MDO9251490.1 hypothetical protein [Hydrogenophaga sp.]MDP3322905.1 hypothetical protein [Hydrogenophaga sp.]MDP3884080.1 hypothetical protein [Hydrogenophaga sp.]
MSPTLEELLARMRTLEEQLEQEYSQHREEFARRRAAMAEHFLELQRRQKVGLWPYLRQSRWPVLLSAPLVYSGWVAFALLDAFVSLYQAVCFPIYGIPKVGRAEYLVFDRADLPYLNVVEKFNCFYCSYGNGVAAYAREVSARTEQYWCPIKHARRLRDAHPRYPQFFEHGDAEAFRSGMERLRQMLRATGDPPAAPPDQPSSD